MASQAFAASQSELQSHPLRTEIRLLFISAMVIFLATVGIGLLNGQHLLNLSHEVLLTHVHSGTLGWITTSVFACCLWIFGAGMQRSSQYIRVFSIYSALALATYVVTFWIGAPLVRSIGGSLVMIAILGLFGWTIARARQVKLGIPHLALLGALFTLIVGSTFGVLLQIQAYTIATSQRAIVPDTFFAAHPAMQTAGYLVLAAMGLAEWRLMPARDKLPISGLIQISLLFLAGYVLVVALLFNLQPLFGLNALLEIAGVTIFIVRFLPHILRINWLERSGKRFFVPGAIFLVVNIVLTIVVVILIVSNVIKDPTEVPGVLLSLDHSIFVGVMTNVFLGLLWEATADRRSVWPVAEDAAFWGLNIGVTGFIVALLLDRNLLLERIFTPIMGLGILLALLVYALRLFQARSVEVVIGPSSD
jgi:hypothetical protein